MLVSRYGLEMSFDEPLMDNSRGEEEMFLAVVDGGCDGISR